MIHKLSENEHPSVLPLAQDASHHLILTAVAEGSSQGTIWVDDPHRPEAALFSTAEGHFLIGGHDDAISRSFAELITGELLPQAEKDGWWLFWLHYWPGDWRPVLHTMLAGCHWVDVYQHYYSFRKRGADPPGDPPPGYRLRRVDAELLGKADGGNVGRIRRWAEGNF
ncbi:MAG: GNAT family protein, partial [Planctomycetota bacterium]